VDICDLHDPSLVELYFLQNKDEQPDKGCKMILDLNERSYSEDNQDSSTVSKKNWPLVLSIRYNSILHQFFRGKMCNQLLE